jgi:hypothetical protein
MVLASSPTGITSFAVTRNFAEIFLERCPNGIDVPTSLQGDDEIIHFKPFWRPAVKPHPKRIRVDKKILEVIAFDVQFYELRELAQNISLEALALGWAAYGFEVLHPRWGQNKIRNEDGETSTSGNNSVAWMTLIAGGNTNGVFGTYFPPTIRAKLKNGATTIQNYAIQTHVDLSDAQGKPLVCLSSFPCHRYLLAAKERLPATIDAGVAHPRARINFCPCITETTRIQIPLGRGGGAGNRRGRGAGRNDIKDFFGKRLANKECDYFKKGTCMHAQKNKTCFKTQIGDPSSIRCKLQNDFKKPCLNGAGCLYKHGPLGADTSNGAGSSSNQCAQPALSRDWLWPPRRLRSPSKRKHRHYPQFKSDSTLGYPGEGPAKIICYNINGAKNKVGFCPLRGAQRGRRRHPPPGNSLLCRQLA